MLVFATPIYYYEMSGQLKTFLDRMNPLYPKENSFREVYLLAASADDAPEAMDGAVKGIEGWVACFDGVCLKGVVQGHRRERRRRNKRNESRRRGVRSGQGGLKVNGGSN